MKHTPQTPSLRPYQRLRWQVATGRTYYIAGLQEWLMLDKVKCLKYLGAAVLAWQAVRMVGRR